MKKPIDHQKILHSKFDIETHKEAFLNYLEVIIREDGEVQYAVPSHQEKLIKICMEKLQIGRQELYDMCPREYMFDVTNWLCKISGCISVWEEFYMGKPNDTQRWVLQNLRHHGLYKGNL